MKRPAKVDVGNMHGSYMAQHLLTDRMAFTGPPIHDPLEMMSGPRHGQIG